MGLRIGKIHFELSNLARRAEHALHSGRTLLSNAGIDRHYRKVFAIGFHKTATTSIHEVFRRSGIRAAHTVTWRKARILPEHYFYQAFSDGPPEDFTLFDRHFRGTRFILNTRDLDEWLESRIEHFRYLEREGIASPSKNPGTDAESVLKWLRTRNDFHLQVLEYFQDRPDDLLIVNFVRDPLAAAKVTRFLGKNDVGEKPFARTVPKVREAGDGKNRDMIEACFRDLGIPPDEWKNDIFCPSLEPESTRLRWPADTARIGLDDRIAM